MYTKLVQRTVNVLHIFPPPTGSRVYNNISQEGEISNSFQNGCPRFDTCTVKNKFFFENKGAKYIFSLLINFLANSFLISALIDNCHETKESMQYNRLVNLI